MLSPVNAPRMVLLVEDHAQLRERTKRALVGLGYEVTDVESAEKALEIVKGGKRFDVLMTDLMLPGGMGGRDLAVQTLEVFPGIKVLIVSGFVDEDDGNEGMTFLKKPYSRTALSETLDRLLAANT